MAREYQFSDADQVSPVYCPECRRQIPRSLSEGQRLCDDCLGQGKTVEWRQDALVQVRDLRVDYDDVCAVRDVSFQIGPGEVYGLIGPNGAGKTTTMRALLGLLEPTYGEIRLNGVDLGESHEKAVSQVGFMPDFPPVYEDLTCLEYLDLFAASYGIPKPQRRPTIDRYLQLVDLTEKRDAFTAGLSRGMKQRLTLAKTLLPEPAIVVLDEPASGMDPHGRLLLKDIMKQLGAQGKAVLVSSHILAEMSEFCTAVGIMERGRMVVTGRVDEIAARVLGVSVMTVEVLSDREQFGQAAAGDPRVGPVTWDGVVASFPFDGGPEEASDLLGRLVASGVRVASFARKKEGLEEVFLKVGAREVS